MLCPTCGAAAADGAATCPNCNAALAPAYGIDPAAPPAPPPVMPPPVTPHPVTPAPYGSTPVYGAPGSPPWAAPVAEPPVAADSSTPDAAVSAQPAGTPDAAVTPDAGVTPGAAATPGSGSPQPIAPVAGVQVFNLGAGGTRLGSVDNARQLLQQLQSMDTLSTSGLTGNPGSGGSPYDSSTPYLKAETSAIRKLAIVAVVLFGVAAVIVGIVVAVIATRPSKATLAAQAQASAAAASASAAPAPVEASAAQAVSGVFAALQTGKVGNVAPFLEAAPSPGGLIDDAVLTKAVSGSHPLTDVRIGAVTMSGDEAAVAVAYQLGTVPVTGSVTVLHTYTIDGDRTWQVESLAGSLEASDTEPLDVVTVYGVKVDFDADALPGWYDVDFSDSRGLVTGATVGVGLAPTQTLQVRQPTGLTLSAAGQTQAQTAIVGALRQCATYNDPLNPDCPFTVPAQNQQYTQSATYKIKGDPKTGIAYHYDAGQDTAVGVGKVTVLVSWTEISVNDATGAQTPVPMSRTVVASYTCEVGLTGDADATPSTDFTRYSQKAAPNPSS